MTGFLVENAKMIALFGFLAGFIWIVFSVFRPSRKREFEEHAQIPFKEPE